MITDKKIVALVIILVFGINLQLKAQFLNISIHIPAGVSFSNDSPRKIMNGVAGNIGEEQIPVTWLFMETKENINFLVSIESHEPGQDQLPIGFYLNHRTWDLSEVKELFPGLNQLTIDSRNLLIRNISPKVSVLQAWLGIPSNKPLNIKIEYP
jgi:hypothetical protein